MTKQSRFADLRSGPWFYLSIYALRDTRKAFSIARILACLHQKIQNNNYVTNWSGPWDGEKQ